MSSIVIGNAAWQNEDGTNTSGGWNSAGRIWGSSSDDVFTFANQACITSVLGSQGWSLDGAGGTDTLDISASTSSASIVMAAANYLNIEVLEGTTLADKLGGSSLADTIFGGAGADSIWGAGGSDLLIGGPGADTYWFGAGDGADTISDEGSDNKSDVAKFYGIKFSALGFSRINSDADLKITVGASEGYTDNLVLANFGGYMANNSANRINKFITDDITFGLAIGTSAADSLVGTSLADYIVGGAGADTIDGGGGNDAIYGGDGNDRIVYSSAAVWIDGGAGTNTLTSAASTTAMTLLLDGNTKIGNFSIIEGSSLADKIGGSAAAETIIGGAGADSIWGAGGNDLLAGGTGADSYWFGVGDGVDSIASDSSNESDTVMFYGSSGAIASSVLSGNNLTITLTSGDSLTLLDWKLLFGYQLSTFSFGTAGVYQLSVAADNTATWTKKTG